MIITCYYDIYDSFEKRMEYINHFTNLANSGLPIMLFTDSTLSILPEFTSLPSSVIILEVPLNLFELYSICHNYKGLLPDNRNIKKDTIEFLSLMNTKIEFFLRASEVIEDNTFIWIDFGILKYIRNHNDFIKKLKLIHEKSYSNIIIPGFLPFGQSFTVNQINCRFCGSLFIIPRKYINIFYNHSKNVITDFCTQSIYKLCWETNVWNIIEACAMKNEITWYFADKDDSLLQNISSVINL